MKQTLIILLLFIGINSYAVTDTTQYVTNSNVEKLVDKYSAKLSASITSLAESLKQPAEHVYKILVKQQIVKSISYSLFWIVTIIFIFIFIKLLKYGFSKEPDSRHNKFYYDEGNITAGVIISGVLGVISLTIALFNTDIIIQGFINPEYGAIKDIVEMIK